MVKFLLIAAGGSVGALLRYAVSNWGQGLSHGQFPTGTLIVNALGCLAIGVVGALFAGQVIVRDEYRMILIVGVLGAFTTYSTFGWETVALIRDGRVGIAGAYVLATNFFALVGVWIGYRVTERLLGA